METTSKNPNKLKKKAFDDFGGTSTHLGKGTREIKYI